MNDPQTELQDEQYDQDIVELHKRLEAVENLCVQLASAVVFLARTMPDIGDDPVMQIALKALRREGFPLKASYPNGLRSTGQRYLGERVTIVDVQSMEE